jgi:rhamnulokinase
VLNTSEIYRFPNEPVRYCGELHWDILRLWQEMQKALKSSSLPKLDSIGIDSWEVDYALLGERGNLLENPFHYRDTRTEGGTGLLLLIGSAILAGFAGSL